MKQLVWWSSLVALMSVATTGGCAPLGFQAVPRDAFPVFDHPPMLSAQEAERRGLIYSRDMVIGIHHGQEAKAYPITVMGVHELGNDTIDTLPIVVGW